MDRNCLAFGSCDTCIQCIRNRYVEQRSEGKANIWSLSHRAVES